MKKSVRLKLFQIFESIDLNTEKGEGVSQINQMLKCQYSKGNLKEVSPKDTNTVNLA